MPRFIPPETQQPTSTRTALVVSNAAGGPQEVFTDSKLETEDFRRAKAQILERIVEKIDFNTIEKLARDVRRQRVGGIVEAYIRNEVRIPLTAKQQTLLKEHVLDDLLGFGPLEVLLADPEVSDIMVNGPGKVYIERNGKIYLSDVKFANERHLLGVIQKIVAQVGRRVDEASPMVDARMPDGSRFNAIIPPLALDGCLVSIRKFRRQKMPLSQYVELGSASPEIVKFLEICANARLNILISGGTGSGKTTLLNALSGHIDPNERIVTIEDTAELQLIQPHVLRLETRPPNMEGSGEVTQRNLVKNALRMRPDRIILGEMRGDEVIDVLSAMNTGHDGSMVTIHANNPRDALSRVEHLIGMSGISLAPSAARAQIASALHLIIQIARMRDGKRRIVQIDEVVGINAEGTLETRMLFGFKPGQMDAHGELDGFFYATGVVPGFLQQIEYYARDKEMLNCIEHSRKLEGQRVLR